MYNKKLIKLLSLTLITGLCILTGCQNKATKQNKVLLSTKEQAITLPEDIKHIQDIHYLGADVYAINISTDVSDAKYKLINPNGDLITQQAFYYVSFPFKGSASSFYNDKFLPVIPYENKNNFKYRLINKKGEFVSEPYEDIAYLGGDVYLFKKNKKYGYINSQGKNIVKPIDTPIYPTGDLDFLSYRNEKGKYGFINSKGKTVVPYEFDDFEYLCTDDDLIAVCKNKKWSFIDKKGNKIKDFIFDDVAMFAEDLVSVKQNGKWGFMDRQGNIKIPFKFDKPSLFSKGTAIVSINSKDCVIDKNGKFIIPPNKFNAILGFGYDLSMVKCEDGLGLINMKGNYIIKPSSKFAGASWDDKNIILHSRVSNTTHTAQLADRNLNILSDEKFEDMYDFQNDLALVSKNNKFGFINRKGKVVIPVEFDNKDNIMNFIDNLCIVNKEGKYGLVDTQGKYNVKLKYDEIEYICKNHYAVKLNNKWGIIDANDNIIKPIEYNQIIQFDTNETCDFTVFLRKDNKGLFLSFKK